MDVRVDNVANRLVGHARNRRGELAALAHAAAGIDHCDRVITNNETDIGDRPCIRWRGQLDQAFMREYAGRYFLERQRLSLRRRRGDTERDA